MVLYLINGILFYKDLNSFLFAYKWASNIIVLLKTIILLVCTFCTFVALKTI